MTYLFFLFLLFISSFGYAENNSLDQLVDQLVAIHQRNSSQIPPIVAIGGMPGVGKTHLTKLLHKALNDKTIRCCIVMLDDFFLTPLERKQIGTEWDMRHFKVLDLHECLFAIYSGEKHILKPTYNQFTFEFGVEMLDLTKIDLVIFEGLYALCTRPPLNFFDYCHTGIFLEASPEDTYEWKWEREQKKTHPRTREQFVIHMETVKKEYAINIAYSKDNASFIVKKNHNHSYNLFDAKIIK